ncbi:capsular polyglutamate synthetase PgsA [soil metagenome]
MKKIYILALSVLLIVIFFSMWYIDSMRSNNSGISTSTPVVVEKLKLDQKNSVNMLFVGDIMLDRTVRTTIEKNGFEYLFKNIESIFLDTDIAIGNLEGTITSNKSLSQKDFSQLKFTFSSSVAKSLRDLGFTGMSLANNHSYDFGKDGFLETMANVGVGNMFTFGSPLNNYNISKVVPVKDKQICYVGYHELYDSKTEVISKEITRLEPTCDFLIVFAHWGTEYKDTPTIAQTKEAHEFIDAGADLIIGAHPHVIQPVEIYKNKAIFYSLGNFIFDQDFSIATRVGLAVRLELTEDKVNFHLIPIEMYKNVLSFPEKEAVMGRMNLLISKLPNDLKTTADVDSVFVLSRD